ncbi:MAG: hypothetical protein B1H13_14620 [Desulfobacteraceae bacterium 4484_190.3]|nr:MAG: hypothetical protein B1H13_14620 [Desulfobacteraceae bacterium 4484_190.3]
MRIYPNTAIKKHAKGKMNWIIGSGGDNTGKILSKMYARGYFGPLWEYLISSKRPVRFKQNQKAG